MLCILSLTFRMMVISSLSSLGCLPHCAIAARTPCSCCQVNRGLRSPRSRPFCGRWLIQTRRRCERCRVRIAISLSLPATAMCSPSTTYRGCQHGFPTRFAALPLVAGSRVRQLYTDQDEVLFDACRPAILNGIEDIVTRPDLADRAVFLTLEAIPEERRRPEQELWAQFESERAAILGALLDAVAHGLRQLPNVHLDRLPRMADFARWSTACETAIWSAGTFWAAYCGNRDEAVVGVIEADPVASTVRAFMATRTEWTGTASELLGALAELVREMQRKNKSWPDTPRALAGRLRRAATFVRKIGIEVAFDREGRARTRTICLTSAPESGGARKRLSHCRRGLGRKPCHIGCHPE
jgi:hypothetical protein